ncbi:MAG: sugar phosphate isomerase/epimerase [Lachnospiraceae bacterium]|nr:sugar phosphate isomerase/epimerase [Lachnospiraceae bacterium]
MRLGTSSPLTHTCPEDWAEKQKSLGLSAINFHLTCQDDPALVDAYVRAAKEKDLMMAEVGVWKNTMAEDPAVRSEAIRYAIGQLELADRIGARCCVNILGAKGPRWDGAYRENYSKETWKQGVAMIREIIDAVNPKNTCFTIESMPWMAPDSPDQYVQLLEEVDRDRFAVHLDVFNWMNTPRRYFFCEEFIDECFEKLGSRIRSCHIKDVKLEENYTLAFTETYPGGGGINIGHLIRRGMEADPEMPFIIEHLDTDEEYIRAVKYVQQINRECSRG